MLLIYLFITLTVDYDYWYAPFLSLMAYFMMLTVFGKRFTVRNDCGSNCFVRVSGSKAIFLHPVVVGKHSIPVIDYSSAYLFLNFSAILPLYLPKVHQSLEETSEPIREYLNDEGLYDTLHEYQLTGSARTGFSENDEQLGGPLYDNGEVVLQRTKKEMAIGRSKIKIITPVLDG